MSGEMDTTETEEFPAEVEIEAAPIMSLSEGADEILAQEMQPTDAPLAENTSDVAASDTEALDLDALEDAVQVDPSLFERRPEAPPFSRYVLTTPLHLSVAAESRTNLWTQWNGFTTPGILTSVDDEYRALRHAAALSDISPVVKYRISGRDAAAYLDRLVADNVLTLSIDEAMPVVFCEDRGYVVGDGHLFRLGEREYRLVTEETHLAWLLDSALGFQVRVEDVSTTLAAMSLQGPLSASVLAAAGFREIETLRPFAARWFDVGGMPAYASRTGDTGGLGYELWIDPEDAPMFWVRLLDRGAPFGLAATGFKLRELARVEAGVPRAGCDYLGAFAAVDPADASTPFELGLAALVDLDTAHFTGRAALRRARGRPPRHFVVSLAIDFSEAIEFGAVRCNGRIAGIATSTAFSRSLGINLAIARLEPASVAPGAALKVEAELRDGFSIRQVSVPARILTEPALALALRHAVPAPLMSNY